MGGACVLMDSVRDGVFFWLIFLELGLKLICLHAQLYVVQQ